MSLERRLAEVVGEEHVEHGAQFGDLPVARPRDESEARELIELARADSLRLRLFGLGSKLAWRAQVGEPDFALSTRRLSGVVEFEPADGTLTAHAGTTMHELRELVRAQGLELTPDVPRPAGATLGGVLGAGASGPDRTRHGASRLHVLGTRALLANGQPTRSGGRLVKNVTGYDLHRLYCGSHGSLALVVEVSLRLFPAPEARRVLRYDCERLEEAIELASAIPGVRVSPRTITILNTRDEAPWCLHVELAGRAAQLDLELERLAALREPDEELRGEAAATRADEARDAEPDAAAGGVLHLASRPSRLAAACAALFDALGELPHGRAVLQPSLATLDLALEQPRPEHLARCLDAARAALESHGARLELRGAVAGELRDPLERIPAPARKLMLRLRETYDPGGLFVAGDLPVAQPS